MTTKTLLTAAILAVAPSLGFAMCTGLGHTETTAMSCAEGTVYDSEAQRCVVVETG